MEVEMFQMDKSWANTPWPPLVWGELKIRGVFDKKFYTNLSYFKNNRLTAKAYLWKTTTTKTFFR